MTHPYSLRLTDEQRTAVDAALTAHRRRTGKATRIADAIRTGLAAFCGAEGVAWPTAATKEPTP